MEIKMEEVYVMHVCKNCGCAFIARDTSNCKDTPSTSKYCPECVENGFRNRAPDREERWLVKLYDFYNLLYHKNQVLSRLFFFF